MIDYGKVFHKAWELVLQDWQAGKISLEREADITHHLFAKCLAIMIESGTPIPYRIHGQETYTTENPREWHKPVDLMLGDSEVLVEVKHWKSPFYDSIWKDIDKLTRYMNSNSEVKEIVFVTSFDITGYGQDKIDQYKSYAEEELSKRGWSEPQWKQMRVLKEEQSIDIYGLYAEKKR